MTIWQARAAVMAGLKGSQPNQIISSGPFMKTGTQTKLHFESVRIASEGISFNADRSRFGFASGNISYTLDCQIDLRIDQTYIVEKAGGGYYDAVIQRPKGTSDDAGLPCATSEGFRSDIGLVWNTPGEAQSFANAVNRLRAAVRGDDLAIQPDAWNDFLLKATAWRALPAKPPVSEEVRQHRILAEHYVEVKDFDSALQEYEAGLAIDPMWPEGHFNAGLLYAELRYYSYAIFHMNSYLALVPDAPDAQQARDQVIIWQAEQRKASAASAPASATSPSPSKKKQR
jgi:tetratricopeptide (TPR) repeat protein